MKLRHLNNNTLVDISRNTDKALRLAKYINDIESPIIFDNIFMITKEMDSVEKINLFDKDLNKTVDMIAKTIELVVLADEDGNVSKLTSSEKNLNVIFGQNYNNEKKTITIAGVELDPKSLMTKDDIKDKILKNFIGIGISDYKTIKKSFDAFGRAKMSENDLENIKYLVIAAETEKHANFIKKLEDISAEFTDYRKKINYKEKSMIDEKITFNRSMVDSIMKVTTYITEDKIEKVAPPHKKALELKEVSKIHKLIKNSKCIDAAEIDPDVDIRTISDLFEKMEDLELNLDHKVLFKARKLGYLGRNGVNGLYMVSQNLVAVNIADPSALIHELVHAVDLGNKEIYESQNRQKIINKYTTMIDTSDPMVQPHIEYFTNPAEVIARLGEISYIFKKYDYKENENMSDFINRVRDEQKEFGDGNIRICKRIDDYLRNKAIYFDIEKLKSEDIMEIKEYYSAYFGVNGAKPESRYLRDIEIRTLPDKPQITNRKRGYENKFNHKNNPFAGVKKDIIDHILETNKKLMVMPQADLVSMIVNNISRVSREKKGLTLNDVDNQLDVIKKTGLWIKENGTKGDKIEILKDSIPLSLLYNPNTTNASVIALNNATSMDEIRKPFDAINTIRRIHYLKPQYQSQVMDAIKDLTDNVASGSGIKLSEITENLTRVDPLTHELYLNESIAKRVVDLNLAKSTDEIYDAVRIAGAGDDLDSVAETISCIKNNDFDNSPRIDLDLTKQLLLREDGPATGRVYSYYSLSLYSRIPHKSESLDTIKNNGFVKGLENITLFNLDPIRHNAYDPMVVHKVIDSGNLDDYETVLSKIKQSSERHLKLIADKKTISDNLEMKKIENLVRLKDIPDSSKKTIESLRVPDDVKPIAIGGLIDKKVSEMEVESNPTSPKKTLGKTDQLKLF